MNNDWIRQLLSEVRDYYCASPPSENPNDPTVLVPMLVELTEQLVQERDELHRRLSRPFAPAAYPDALVN